MITCCVERPVVLHFSDLGEKSSFSAFSRTYLEWFKKKKDQFPALFLYWSNLTWTSDVRLLLLLCKWHGEEPYTERTFSMAELVLHYMLAQGALIIKNHSMTEVGRDIWRSFGPTPQLRQRHPDQGVQGHVQVALVSSRRRPCSLSGQPVPVPLYKWVKNSKKQEKYVISHSVPGMPSILSKKSACSSLQWKKCKSNTWIF